MYRNGIPPFSGCRSQHAHTHLWAETGRVFQQFALHPGSTVFYPHLYACLFDAPSTRVDFGENYPPDDWRLNFHLAGPFLAFIRHSCAMCIWDGGWIEVYDVRDGSEVAEPDVGYWIRLSDLALKANGSVAWTRERLALRADGYPIGYNTQPPIVEAREVWALDTHGQRLLDSSPSLDPNSLELNESTLTWINDGTTHSATLD